MYYIDQEFKEEEKKLFSNILDGFSYTSSASLNDANFIILSKSALISDVAKDFVLATNMSDLTSEEMTLVKGLMESGKINFILDLSFDRSFTELSLRRYILTLQGEKDHYLKSIAQNLGQFINVSKAELQKVKSIHEKVVPLRGDEIRGLRLLSKYAAGQSSGGDFFDLIKRDKQIVILLFSTNSYISSTIVLSEFEKLNSSSSFTTNDLKSFITSCSKSIRSMDISDDYEENSFDIFMAIGDLSQYVLEGYNFGQNCLFSGNETIANNTYPVDKAFFEKAYFNIPIDAGERYHIVSSGVRENTQDMISGKSIEEYFIGYNRNIKSEDFINETFFQLKRDMDGSFLDHDSSIIILEAQKGIIKSL